MRAVVQRVSSAHVEVENEIVGKISNGLLVLLGVEKGDVESDLNYLVDKVSGLRVFEDDAGKMNLSVASAAEAGAQVLVVSQFTLLGDVRKGKRPAFTSAEDPEIAKATYQEFVGRLKASGLGVETGVFAADMQVHLVNDGPVTILLDSRKKF